jgi:hypothetical protein
MMKPVIFGNVEQALRALNRMFRGLEAIIEDGGEHFLVGVMRTVDGPGDHQWSELKPGLNMFSFRLETMPGKCASDEQVIGLQIGVRGEFCGTMDDFREFRDLAMTMTGVWGLRRIGA